MLPQKYKLVLHPFQLIFGIALIMSFKFLILSEAHLALPQNRFFSATRTIYQVYNFITLLIFTACSLIQPQGEGSLT